MDTKVLFGTGFVVIAASCIVTGFLLYRVSTPPVQIAAFLILVGVGTLMFGVYVLEAIYRPIHTLTDVVTDISQGDAAAEIPNQMLDRSDDIGELARAFDRTLISLKLALKREPLQSRKESKKLLK